ncbi:hypothetical protein ACFOHT_04935 [Massilia oculi]|uniref:Uncharacterized protein n=1 Tax=Massilia oculi TaxID=945844 RepID=A0A2S2DDF6_9BURK|nr:hypothetical protein [Massilia oculi]AWL03413.1 hypothetical protein DIR46_02385 [Massilia oculi]
MSNPFDRYDPPAAGANPFDRYDAPAKAEMKPKSEKSTARRLLEGGALGIADIGNTLLNAGSYLPGKVTNAIREALPAEHRHRIPDIAQATRTRNADFDALTEENKDSTAFKAGRLGANIAATLPVGGTLAAGARAAGASPALVSALASSGMQANGLGGAAGLGVRALGGGISGAASAGLVSPDDALAGGAIGAGLPVAGKAALAVTRGTGRAMRGGAVKPEVANLARRAQELGIDVPVDRITNSKPLNAIASSLNYVPFSGRAATEEAMQSQLNRALSRTFGQDSDNVTMALRNAQQQLGGEFDRVLSSNKVRVDSQFLDELAEHEATAFRELGADGAGIISRQIDEIMSKGASGELDGQAAYNVKKMLDRIGKRNSPEAHYATELRRSLMGALNRSIGPEAAEAFGTTRKQYGNMLALERLAQNGVDGDISIGRLANMRNIGNQDLQELADIAAQFLKSREGNHGAAQRAVVGGVTAMASGPVGLAAGAAAGRGVNSVLNSKTAKKLVLDPAYSGLPIEVQLMLARSAPVLGSQ